MTASIDSSTRFILPPGHPYPANLAALWNVDPALARAVEDVEDTSGFVVEASKAGPPTLAVRRADGRICQLHSKYDPIAEAQKLLEPVKAESLAFYLLGLGLGYHVEALFALASREALIFVFESDLRLLRTTLEHRDLSKLIASGRVTIFTRADKAEIFNKLTPLAAMCSMGFEGVTHAPSVALLPDFFGQIQTIIGDFASYSRTCLNTLVLNGRRTAANITRNIERYAATPSVNELRDRYKGRPAIIVSAGPSLRKNKEQLREADGKAVIIAVQTILQPLLDMGIEPQFVTSLDYHDISTRYYEKLPRDLKTHLVAEPKASPKIFDLFPGPVTILGNDYADKLLREDKPDKGRLPSGATVAHLAYYLAEHLGCDPIIFIGQDLGFSDGLAYVPGTNIDDVWRPELSRFCTVEMKQWEFIARERPILRKIADQQGGAMYTEERLYTYLQQFERDFLRTKTKIIDATEGGARKRGAEVMPLREAISQFCDAPVEAASSQSQITNRKSQIPHRLAARRDEAMQIAEISRLTQPLLEEVRDHLTDQARVNRAIARIDILRARMDTLGPTYDLITQLTQSTELERFRHDRRIASEKLDGLELQRRQITRDIGNVRAITEAASEFIALIDSVIGRHQAALKEVA